MATVIPLFPTPALTETLAFYRALGFTVTHEQTEPYAYGALQEGDLHLHFSNRLQGRAVQEGGGSCLVLVSGVENYHERFADGLREHYGRVPTAGHPRITRLQPGQTRFSLFDPVGNVLIYIDYDEPETEYGEWDSTLSPLAGMLVKAAFLRDTYSNDEAAAGLLDKALARHTDAAPIDRARGLAARAELAVALGDVEAARLARVTLSQVELTDEERERFRDELEAADRLERWVTEGKVGGG